MIHRRGRRRHSPYVNPIAPAIAERLAAAFADVEHRVKIDEYGELLLEIQCPSPSVDRVCG